MVELSVEPYRVVFGYRVAKPLGDPLGKSAWRSGADTDNFHVVNGTQFP